MRFLQKTVATTFAKTKCCDRLKSGHYLLKGADMKHFENKRYLDLTDRYDIEIGLSMRDSFKKIAEDVGCHPSTVAREILENRYFIKGKYFMRNDCRKAAKCYDKRHLCGNELCNRRCIACSRWDCRQHCKTYVKRHCVRIDEPPYVCNNCCDNYEYRKHCKDL